MKNDSGPIHRADDGTPLHVQEAVLVDDEKKPQGFKAVRMGRVPLPLAAVGGIAFFVLMIVLLALGLVFSLIAVIFFPILRLFGIRSIRPRFRSF